MEARRNKNPRTTAWKASVLCEFLVGILVAFLHLNVHGQLLPVGTTSLEDKYRRDQILGKIDTSLSFSIRPLNREALSVNNLFDPDATQHKHLKSLALESVDVQLMPVIWKVQYTSSYPYGYNDGAMIPNVGFQTLFSTGVNLRYKFVSLQINPEFVTAQNRAYNGYDGKSKESWQLWYSYRNNIDMPERFGEGSYTRLLPGQSSLRFNFDPISFGISTENIWWGPGLRNSLLMSNTAPGFPHLTLNTINPIRTGIGSFEGQIIAGKLKSSGFPPTRLGNPAHYDEFYIPKPDDWRYFSGAIFSYQPKWITGFTIGFGQTFIVYRNDMGNGLNDFLPYLGPKSSSPIRDPANIQGREERKSRDLYSSLFARWVMPSGKLEVYGEYGRNDPPFDNRDKIVDLEHSRGYVLGFRKFIPLKADNQTLLELGLELSDVSRSRTARIRNSPSWYGNSIVRDGYTNLGQMLGAGIGPGGKVQSFNISWVKGIKMLGLLLERYEHDADFYYQAVFDQRDYRRNWVDVSASLHGNWDYKNFIFSAKAQFIHAFNYQYELGERITDQGRDFWNFYQFDKFNFQTEIGLMYRF